MADLQSVVLVTGASSGIGKTTVDHLALSGHRVFAGVRKPDAVAFPDHVEVVALDVTDDASVDAAIALIVERAGRIDAVVNNAGSAIVGAVEETTIEQARALFETNVFGVLRVSQAVMPVMRRQGHGRIVNISSVAGLLPLPYMGVYTSTKHALEGLSETMDHEVRSFGVRVVLIEPGFVRTNIGAASAVAGNLLPEYATQRDRVSANIADKIVNAPSPMKVVRAVERAISAPKFVRIPVGGEAALLSRLRKWAPAVVLDSGIRKSFNVDH